MVISLKKIKRNEKLYFYIWLLTIFLCCVFVIFLYCSLLSFNPHDLSWFYYTTSNVPSTNLCGALGAHFAAFMIFFFGGIGSLFVSVLFTFITYLFIRKKTYVQELDRILAYGSLIFLTASASNFYKIDVLSQQLPGGLIGFKLQSLLSTLFDPFLLSLFFVMTQCAALILISRLSCIGLATFLVHAFARVITKERVVEPVIRGSYKLIIWTMIPVVWLYKRTRFLLSGTEIKQSNFVAFELDDDSVQEDFATDQFWQTYADVPKKDNGITVVPDEVVVDNQLCKPEMLEQLIHKPVSERTNIIKPYQTPSVSWFKVENENLQENAENCKSLAAILEEKLERFGIHGKVTSIKVGPVITLFEYQPEIDSKISKIIALEDDLALALQALSIRIIAPIPGRAVVGFEVSNKQRRMVLLGSVLQSPDFKNFSGHLPLVLGQDSIGNTVIVDLAVMPHLLVAGSTGSGKSVALNTMLVSLLCKHSPDKLKLILIDPKRLEFAAYGDIGHLLVPIVTDPRKAALVLKWVVKTMEDRYARMEACNVRNIFDYHSLGLNDVDNPPMPFIVIMIDELSDLMMTAPKETEDLIARITQMARAAGIHMVVATQRPSVDVITGLIKVNFPSRISFRVTSKIDSRTILDCNGADKLLGKGDMLFLDSSSSLKRAHAAFVSDKEIEKVVSYIRSQQQVQYINPALEFVNQSHDDADFDDQMYHDILRFVESVDEVSISLLQRKFRIGYNRSARIIDKLEAHGIIMLEPGGKTRKVIR